MGRRTVRLFLAALLLVPAAAAAKTQIFRYEPEVVWAGQPVTLHGQDLGKQGKSLVAYGVGDSIHGWAPIISWSKQTGQVLIPPQTPTGVYWLAIYKADGPVLKHKGPQNLTIVPPGSAIPKPGGKTPARVQQEACTAYARTAVAQAQKNLQDQCGFTGPRWSPNYDEHHRWCMGPMGGIAGAETQARQDDLATCARKSTNHSQCKQYAEFAVLQHRKNLEQNCGATGPLWHPDYQHHYNWCMHGDNAKQSAQQWDARGRALSRCEKSNPLDGDFTIQWLQPHFDANGLVSHVDIKIEATSRQLWSFGDFGNPQYGSLWVELKTVNYFWKGNAPRPEAQNHRFAIRGVMNQPLMAPVLGTQYGAGTRTITLQVAPSPNVRLAGVQQMVGTSGVPVNPSMHGCWKTYPHMEVRVHIATRSGTKSKSMQKDIWKTPLKTVFVGDKSGGLVLTECDLPLRP
jgi:hypothetical protein